jgi:hypothetical protein
MGNPEQLPQRAYIYFCFMGIENCVTHTISVIILASRKLRGKVLINSNIH